LCPPPLQAEESTEEEVVAVWEQPASALPPRRASRKDAALALLPMEMLTVVMEVVIGLIRIF
jgi:hypothetical protein